MVDVNLLDSFLNADTCKDGDVIEVVGEGKIEAKKDPTTQREYSVLNLPVKLNGRSLTYSPNSDATRVLKTAWGMNTTSWIGKKFSVKIYPKMSFGVTKNAILPVVLTATKL